MPANLFQAGDRVYAVASPNITGTVVAVRGNQVRVAFDEGGSAWCRADAWEYWTRPESAQESDMEARRRAN